MKAVAYTEAFEVAGQGRNADWGNKCADGSSCIEDGSGERTVLFGEIFSRHFDGSREVSRFADGQHDTCGDEIIDAGNGNGRGDGSGSRNHFSHVPEPQAHFGSPSAECMQAGTDRPDGDGPQVSFLAAQPVNKSSGKKVGDGIDHGKNCGNGSVVCVCPVKLWCDKVFPRQGKHLSVQVVDRSGKKEHETNHPSIVAHFVA